MFQRGKSYRICALHYKLLLKDSFEKLCAAILFSLMAIRKTVRGIIFSGAWVKFNVTHTYQKK